MTPVDLQRLYGSGRITKDMRSPKNEYPVLARCVHFRHKRSVCVTPPQHALSPFVAHTVVPSDILCSLSYPGEYYRDRPRANYLSIFCARPHYRCSSSPIPIGAVLLFTERDLVTMTVFIIVLLGHF